MSCDKFRVRRGFAPIAGIIPLLRVRRVKWECDIYRGSA